MPFLQSSLPRLLVPFKLTHYPGLSLIDRKKGREYPQTMRFDPAIAAQTSFKLALESGELGNDLEAVREAEETFSATAGAQASAAYRTLQEIGERHSDAIAFQEFLIYITWQQVTEETLPVHFKKGLALCDRYLKTVGQSTKDHDQRQVRQIRELRTSFCGGLGLMDEEDSQEEYDRDAFKGGD